MGPSFIPFISYSSGDGSQFARWLCDQLQQSVPSIKAWLDIDHLPPGFTYTRGVAEAIGGCDLVLAVLSRDALNSDGMDEELLRAKRLRKPIIPLRLHDDAELPLPLEGRQAVDFSADRSAGLEELRRRMDIAMSPQGVLAALREGMRSARHELVSATGDRRSRLEREVVEYEATIAEHERSSRNRPQPRRRPRPDGGTGRRGRPGPTDRPRTLYVNELPAAVPGHFQDRKLETERLDELLRNQQFRLVAVCGPDGIGKSMMVAELLKKLGSKRAAPDAVVWLRAHGARPVSAAVLLTDLGRAANRGIAAVEPLLANPDLTVTQKLEAVLRHLGQQRVIVAIDNVEELLDGDSNEFRDSELDELIRALGIWSEHGVKVVLVTQKEPEPLLESIPGNVSRLRLDTGLMSPYAETFLRTLDANGAVGLRTEIEAQLAQAARLTDGHPRALEALYAVLAHNRDRSLQQLLDEMARQPSARHVRDFLIGEMFDQLNQVERRIVQALAVYGRPVAPDAVEYLLRPYLYGYEIDPPMQNLLTVRLIRQDGERFFLPSVDRLRVLGRIPRGRAADRGEDLPPLTQLALFHRASEYLALTRPRKVERVEDLSNQLAEIDLRIQAEEYEKALALSYEIDVQYLRRWGYSQVLVGRLSELTDKLNDPQLEVALMDLLGNAEQADEQKAIAHHSKALLQAEELGDPEDLARANINLGSDYLDSGQVRQASARYRRALDIARQHELVGDEIAALVNLSLCDGETGRFAEALERHGKALDMIRACADEDDSMEELEVELILHIGYWYGLLGEPEFALDHLRQGRDLAQARDLQLLDGQFRVAIAEVLLDQSDRNQALVGDAIELITGAVELGERNRNPQLLRDAYWVLALGQLCAGSLDLARAAADAACGYPATRSALGAFVLQGVTALRQDRCGDAIPAFTRAHLQAARLRGRDSENYAVADIDALALCGLALCGEREHLEEAEAAFAAARAVTKEPGIVKRAIRLLDAIDTQGLLTTARMLASGQE
jgi:tetratricopeptide (TPR) repeat protein